MGRKKMSHAEQVRQLAAQGLPPKEIASRLKLLRQYVYQVMSNQRKQIKGGAENQITTLPITMEEPKSDPVNHPAHYKAGGIETIDFIEAKQLNYNLGNVIKYITRSDLKGNRKQDLEKALWYLKREVEKPQQPT